MKRIARVVCSFLIAAAQLPASAAFVDTDADAIPDNSDNCTLVANPTQLDTDGDGHGNLCDADINNSGLTTTTDFNQLRGCLNLPASTSPNCAAADMNGNGDGRTDLLSYDAATGRANFSIAASTNCANGVFCGQVIVAETDVAAGFTSIVPVDLDGLGGTDLLWYNAATVQAMYTVASSAGCAGGVYCGQAVVSVQSAGPGWNVVVPVQMDSVAGTDLVWYQ